ncbi:hypothetical protein BJY52DRAFT_1416600 [Lactarius psammicola]|nr:hypothetical protein BJY52DRAFT_1416600 [Lactarius psammicola]
MRKLMGNLRGDVSQRILNVRYHFSDQQKAQNLLEDESRQGVRLPSFRAQTGTRILGNNRHVRQIAEVGLNLRGLDATLIRESGEVLLGAEATRTLDLPPLNYPRLENSKREDGDFRHETQEVIYIGGEPQDTGETTVTRAKRDEDTNSRNAALKAPLSSLNRVQSATHHWPGNAGTINGRNNGWQIGQSSYVTMPTPTTQGLEVIMASDEKSSGSNGTER